MKSIAIEHAPLIKGNVIEMTRLRQDNRRLYFHQFYFLQCKYILTDNHESFGERE